MKLRCARCQVPGSLLFQASAVALLVTCATFAVAQADDLQQRYNNLIARCNDGSMPRPQRDACVRDAGLVIERARMGSSGNSETENRSTVISPSGASGGGTDSSTLYTSPDGRAVVVPPAGSAPPADAVTQ